MNTLRLLFLTLLASVLLGGCKEDEMPPDQGFDETAVVNELKRTNPDLNSLTSKGYQVTESPLVRFSDNQSVGTSYLVRYDEGILAVVKSEDLEPGTAATLWWVLFNAPEHCEGDCDGGDTANDAVKADALYADGQTIDGTGQAIFTSHRKLHDRDGSMASVLWKKTAVGIEDARKVEAHLVVRTHGPVIPEQEKAMISTFNGGCQGFPPEAGEPGPNTCANIQFAIHLPDKLSKTR